MDLLEKAKDAVEDMIDNDPGPVADNQEVTHESGMSRMGNAVMLACASPLFMLGAIILVGWNEKRSVCYAKAIEAGEDAVKEVGCTSSDVSGATAGDLVLFSCDLSTTGLTPLSVSGDFSSYVSTSSICLEVTSAMYQCVETRHSETQKDSVGGGTTTVHTYTYSKEWQGTAISSSSFHSTTSTNFQTNCGATNPAWPSSIPKSSTQTAPTAKAGSWTLPRTGYLSSVPCNSSFEPTSTPAGWTRSGQYYQSTTAGGAVDTAIGATRIKFETNDWSNPTVTVLAAKKGSDTVEDWVAPDSWLCSGTTLGSLRSGAVSKADMFDSMKGENRAITWLLRIIGFAILWCAWDCLGRPLEVAADCIPCIGPCLGDMVEAIVCCVSCIPATACCMFVAGIVWCAMRPMIGGPLLCLAIMSCVGLMAFFAYSRANKKEDGPAAEAAPPQTMGNPQMMAGQPQMMQQPQMMPMQGQMMGQPQMMPMQGQMMPVQGQQPMQMMQMPNGQVVYVQPGQQPMQMAPMQVQPAGGQQMFGFGQKNRETE